MLFGGKQISQDLDYEPVSNFEMDPTWKETLSMKLDIFIIKVALTILMGYCKKDVTPLLTHWSYVFLALTH